jgi:hypothetical protein
MTSIRSAAPRPPPLSNFPPSVAKIIAIERKYTGASKLEHVSHEDAQASIAALGKGVDVQARKELAGFVFAFGGNQFNPKSEFSAPDRKAALKAIMSGIETGDRLAKQPPAVQLGVLNNLMDSSFGPMLGVKSKSVSTVADPVARKNIDAALKSIAVPARFGTKPFNSGISMSTRGGKPYGYSVTQTYIDSRGAELGISVTLNAKGTVLGKSHGITPADNTPED